MFAQQFCNGVAADPPRSMMTTAEAADLMKKLGVFLTAYSASTNPATRTRGTIIAKDDARSILQNSISNNAAFIRINLGITDGDKVNIGVRPRNVAHNKRQCPNAPPLLKFIGSYPGKDELRYHHSNTPNLKARPYGAARLELWVAYSGPGEPRPKVSDAKLVGSFTQSKMIVKQDLEQLEQGRRPTYWARWAGYSDNKGPNVSSWSIPISMASAAKANNTAKKNVHHGGTESTEVGARNAPMKRAA